MKTKFLILFFLSTTIILKAQNWCPPGAEWYYTDILPFHTGYSHFKYSKDSLINNVVCKKIDYYKIWSIGPYNYYDTIKPIFTYELNGVVFIYNDLYGNNKFDTVFNINAQIGDKWKMYKVDTACADSLYFMKVLNVGTKSINGFNLKWIYVHKGPFIPSAGFKSADTIVEKIGTRLDYTYNLCSGQSENNGIGPLRCYSDSLFGSYSTGISPSCSYFPSTISENNSLKNIKVFPSPITSSQLNISYELKDNTEAQFEIYNMLGAKIQSFDLVATKTKETIDISLLKSGIYFYNVVIDNKIARSDKIVILK